MDFFRLISHALLAINATCIQNYQKKRENPDTWEKIRSTYKIGWFTLKMVWRKIELNYWNGSLEISLVKGNLLYLLIVTQMVHHLHAPMMPNDCVVKNEPESRCLSKMPVNFEQVPSHSDQLQAGFSNKLKQWCLKSSAFKDLFAMLQPSKLTSLVKVKIEVKHMLKKTFKLESIFVYLSTWTFDDWVTSIWTKNIS